MKTQIIEVPFRSDVINAIEVDGVIYVAMRRIVENLGMSWATQTVKLNRQREKFSCFDIETTGSDGKTYQMLCIPLRKLNGWLFSINPNKVRADIRDGLIAYQEECFTALHDYFTKGEAKRKAPVKKEPEYRYRVKLIICDGLTGTTVEMLGKSNEMRDVASGISTDLGFKPNAFTLVPMNMRKFKQIH
jgi:hypothetical protein